MTTPKKAVLTKQELLTDVLRQVSRSFYLTLQVLPRSLRDQIGLAYLFARTADTIADTDLLGRSRRLDVLQQFRDQFHAGRVDWACVRDIKGAIRPYHTATAEHRLMEQLDFYFRLFEELDRGDKERLARFMGNLTPGMEMDLRLFLGDRVEHLMALPSPEDLDRYIYHVAGCVGEFWTEMSHAHVPTLHDWNVAHMSKIGVRFGKGLQLTNVLKDLARDLRRGRCYIPESFLRESGLRPRDLLKKETLPAFRPILSQLTSTALEHLDQGWLYTLAIPQKEIRLRLACMWPILFAGETLRLVVAAPNLLDPTVNVKMTRGKVYSLIAMTTATFASGPLWTAYWARLRKRIP